MKSGKLLCLLGGLITLVATFLFAWFVVDITGTLYYGHGLGVLFSLPETFGNAEAIAISWGVPTFAIYIVGGFMIFFIFSWILILLGVKNRVVPIIGGFTVIGIAIAILVGPFGAPPNILDYIALFSNEGWGVFPFNVVVGPVVPPASISLGTYLLIAGGVLGIIGGFLPRK